MAITRSVLTCALTVNMQDRKKKRANVCLISLFLQRFDTVGTRHRPLDNMVQFTFIELSANGRYIINKYMSLQMLVLVQDDPCGKPLKVLLLRLKMFVHIPYLDFLRTRYFLTNFSR